MLLLTRRVCDMPCAKLYGQTSKGEVHKTLSLISPYKKRKVDLRQPVTVYRNLNRQGPGVWYSIRQKGVVVGHAQYITLEYCLFVVNESGRRRALISGRRNVHAFVKGCLVENSCGARAIDLRQPGLGIRYDLSRGGFVPRVGNQQLLRRASCVYLNQRGVSAVHTES